LSTPDLSKLSIDRSAARAPRCAAQAVAWIAGLAARGGPIGSPAGRRPDHGETAAVTTAYRRRR
jgi:hypothetical protein